MRCEVCGRAEQTAVAEAATAEIEMDSLHLCESCRQDRQAAEVET